MTLRHMYELLTTKAKLRIRDIRKNPDQSTAQEQIDDVLLNLLELERSYRKDFGVYHPGIRSLNESTRRLISRYSSHKVIRQKQRE